MAKKSQVTEAHIASLKEEIEKLRIEHHNLKRSLTGRGYRLTRLAGMMLKYFRKETALLNTEEDAHNVSSDIIESSFGYF